MTSKILFVNQMLGLGGGEKYLIELCEFAKKNNIVPEVLIFNNTEVEFYDKVLFDMNVKVYRKQIISGKRFYLSFFKSIFFWNIKYRYLLNFYYDKIHFINLGATSDISTLCRHRSKFFWHIGNRIQYNNGEIPCPIKIIEDPKNTIICINKYQIDELKNQFVNINCQLILFGLFLNKK